MAAVSFKQAMIKWIDGYRELPIISADQPKTGCDACDSADFRGGEWYLALIETQTSSRMVIIDDETECINTNTLPHYWTHWVEKQSIQVTFPPLLIGWDHPYDICMCCIEEARTLIRLEDQYRVSVTARNFLFTILNEHIIHELSNIIYRFLSFPQSEFRIPSRCLQTLFCY